MINKIQLKNTVYILYYNIYNFIYCIYNNI